MAELSEVVEVALIRVARTADEIRNGLTLATSRGDVRLVDTSRSRDVAPER